MDLLLIGASVRAAAASLWRIGGRPVAFDLYGDLDLAAIAESVVVTPGEYPAGIPNQLGHLPPMPWIYTGAIENNPEVVASIARRFRLLGNGAAILRRVKDPFQLEDVARTAGVATPRVCRTATQLPTDGTWLEKPFRSGGGEGIIPWRGVASVDPSLGFYQERVAGLSAAAIFVRSGPTTRLAGVTRQYLGRPGQRFAYRGSLGPWPLTAAVERTIIDLGKALGAAFGLIGLFGVDLVLDREQVWTIEINPRYTASVEVLEHALGRSLLADHLRACGEPIAASDPLPPTDKFVAKAVLFARRTARLTKPVVAEPSTGSIPGVADIPRVGTEFLAGQPILTVFGAGRTPRACRLDLARRIHRWRAWLELAVARIKPGY